MSLLNSHLGLILVGFSCVICILLMLSRIKSARYERESLAQLMSLNTTLREQQQGMQDLYQQVAALSRFQDKSSKLALRHIARNAQLIQSVSDELKQGAGLRAFLAETITEVQDSIQQTGQVFSEALENAQQRLSAEITGITETLEHRYEAVGHKLDQLKNIEEPDAAELLRDQFELIRQQLLEQSDRSRSQRQQLGKIIQAASKLSSNQHQSLTELMDNLKTFNESQFLLLMEDQAAIKDELQQSQVDMTDAEISALQDVAQDIINHIQSTQSDVLSELKSVQYSVEETISSAEEELLSETRSLSEAQDQLSSDLEQFTLTATEQHLAVISETADDTQNQLARSIQSSLHEAAATLRDAIDRVEGDLKSDNKKLAQALKNIQQQNAK